MSYLYRCNSTYKSGQFKGQRCTQRHSLKKKVEQYSRTKKCPSCKNEITYMDKWQMKKNKENVCLCAAFIHPHRSGSGSGVWCVESKNEPTEDDYKARYG